MSNPVSSYFQLSDPVDGVLPGDDKQLIDLDEYYEETGQPVVDAMVQGSESLALNRFSRDIAIQLKLKNAYEMDPFPTERNAVMGAEGFISTITEGFKKFIEGIIKYIKMAFKWVMEHIKGLLGFRKSARINQAINDSFENLREEFRQTLNGLGFPGANYNLEKFIGEFPNATDRIGQLTILRTKFETDEESIEALRKVFPLFEQIIGKLTAASDKAIRASENLKRTIRNEYNATRGRAHLREYVDGANSPEVNRVQKAVLETLTFVKPDGLVEQIGQLLETLYKVKFNNEALNEGFHTVRETLKENIQAQRVKLTRVNTPVIMDLVQQLNAAYMTISDKAIDMSRIRLSELGNLVDVTDAEKVKSIAGYYQVPGLLSDYQGVAVAMRNFSQYCQSVTSQLLAVENQVAALVGWYHRSHMWYYHGLLDDIEKLREINIQAREAGHSPVANAEGYPTLALDFIPEADAKTFLEKMSGTMKIVIENDIGELRSKYNALARQTGWGRPV